MHLLTMHRGGRLGAAEETSTSDPITTGPPPQPEPSPVGGRDTTCLPHHFSMLFSPSVQTWCQPCFLALAQAIVLVMTFFLTWIQSQIQTSCIQSCYHLHLTKIILARWPQDMQAMQNLHGSTGPWIYLIVICKVRFHERSKNWQLSTFPVDSSHDFRFESKRRLHSLM